MSAPHPYRTIPEIHDAFDRGELKPSALAKHYLERAKSSKLNAWIRVCEKRALTQAASADQLLERTGRVPRVEQPLFGIPMGIKDNLVLDGVTTTCGSRLLENYRPPYTATCVSRLEAAGAVILGKLNLDEFAMGGSNENSAFGPVLHPTHPDRVPGGSSGGAAAAVRAGECFAALGSDTGGSVRLPASFCGVAGFKPTYGAVSRYGLVAFASSLDQVGPLAPTVADAMRVFAVISAHDPRDSTSGSPPPALSRDGGAGWRGVRVGVPSEFFVAGLDPEVESSVRAALKTLESQGAKLVPISLPHSKYAVAVYYLVAVSEASSNLARFDGIRYGVRPPRAVETSDLNVFYRAVRSAFGPEVKRRIILGTFALSSGYSDAYYRRASQVRRLIQQEYLEAFRQVDLIAGPVAPTPAFRLGEKSADPLTMYLNDIYTIPANLGGFPALSVPCGANSAGLPIGLHLMAPQNHDYRLFELGSEYERASIAGGTP